MSFLSGRLFLEPKYSDTSASSGTPMGKNYSHLIFQTEGTDVPGRAGFARRTRCSEIWTASSGDLHSVKYVTNSSAFETLAHACTKNGTYRCTSAVSNSSQPYKKSSIWGFRQKSQIKYFCTGETLPLCFAGSLWIIYRFPGGDILLHKREYFVTLVKREAVQNISQQDEGCGSRADTCTGRMRVMETM